VSAETPYLIDLSQHGRIRVTGEDRARLIHALSTNHIQQMKPGESVYAFFLTAQGRILADARIVCYEDSLLIDTEPETRELLFKHIDHYIIADDVTLEDETEQTFCQESESGRVYGLLAQKPEHTQFADAHAIRLQYYRPRYGEDITGKTLPQETGITQALHFQKGCYLGQEIVERIHARGHVNRMLSGLQFETEAPPPGTKVYAGEAEAGEITSAFGSHAIAMLRMEHTRPNTPLTAGSVKAVTHPIGF
jgi:folate-binding protein YgfZ